MGKAKSLAAIRVSRAGKTKSLAAIRFSCAGKAKSLAAIRFSRGKSKIRTLRPWRSQWGQACHPRAQRASSRRDHHADAGSAKQLLWFDRTGTTEGVVGEPVTDALFFAKLSPDERRIAINQSVQGNMDLWLFDFGRGGKTRLTFDPSFDAGPVGSPDGKWIAFVTRLKSVFDVYMKADP